MKFEDTKKAICCGVVAKDVELWGELYPDMTSEERERLAAAADAFHDVAESVFAGMLFRLGGSKE